MSAGRTTGAQGRRTRETCALFLPDQFDWDALTALYPWVARMRGVVQNPVYHAEGDVWTHTSLVAETLMALPEWQALAQEERGLLYASALLHDVAKPVCTTFDDGGVASSPGHARRGEPMAREILERCGVETYGERELAAKLVRHHGLPLWFLEKHDTSRAIVRTSMDVRLDLVALLAEADVRGRICADQATLLDTIDLFRETCADLQCYGEPRVFESDHARFAYFRNGESQLAYSAYDDRTFTATLMCGLPGSGKDTWIAKHADGQPVVSLDEIRRERQIAPGENQGEVIATAKERAKTLLRERHDFLWNATNLTRLVRDPLIDLFASYGARIRVVFCHAPIERALRQNAKREGVARVPNDVIWAMLARLDPPSLADCHELVISED